MLQLESIVVSGAQHGQGGLVLLFHYNVAEPSYFNAEGWFECRPASQGATLHQEAAKLYALARLLLAAHQ